MKRYIAIMLALLMVGTTAGCSRAKDLFPESTATGKNGQTEAIDEEGLKIGYVLPSGTDGTDTISRVGRNPQDAGRDRVKRQADSD